MRRAGHVVLRVTDVPRAKGFLEKVLGFQISGSIDSFFFMTANPVSNHHMIAVRPGKPGLRMPDAARQIGMVSVAYEVADFAELQRIYHNVVSSGAAYGARLLEVRRRGSMSGFVVAEPDGNHLEFYAFEPDAPVTPLSERLNEPAPGTSGPSRIRGTSHVTLRVADLERSRAFYEDFLLMQPFGSDDDGRYYLAGAPDARRPLLALERAASLDVPVPTPRAMFGMDHFSFELGSFEQLQHAYARFKETNTPFHHAVDHGVTLSLYFHDPDGNLMEVYHDVPRAEYIDPLVPFTGPGELEPRLEAVR